MKNAVSLLALFLLPAGAWTESRDLSSWNNLERLQSGQEIEVVDMKFKTHSGEFSVAGPEELTLQTKAGPLVLKRDSVLRVSSREQSRRLRNALIGAAVGGGAALVIGAIADRRFSNEGREHIAKTIFTPVGLGVGAGLGAAVPGFEVIYRADRNAVKAAQKRD